MVIETTTIPPFDKQGVLPDGVYTCDEGTLESRFSVDFPGSTSRSDLTAGFLSLRARAAAMRLNLTQWVAGPYVTDQLNPTHLGLTSFCDYDMLKAVVDQGTRDEINALLNGQGETKKQYGCETFLVPCCHPGHVFYPAFEEVRKYFRKWGGRTPQGGKMGFIQMAVGRARSAPDIATRGI